MTAAPKPPRRRLHLLAASWGLVLAAGLLAGCAGGPAPQAAETASAPSMSAAPADPAPEVTGLPAGVVPARVAIPLIGLDEPLIDLGLTADARMEVPADYDDVGWFTGGGRPGGRGPVVIAGHVDSPTGPAIFFRLHELAVDDVIDVTDAQGARHSYRVVEVADYAKSDFPTVRVFGATASDELRLITCGGVFDPAAGSYEENRVVFAERT